MSKPRKPSPNAQAFEREVKRLQRLIKIAENKGIVFISSPIPEKPAVVTRKRLNLIHSITKSDIESKGYTLDKETGELQNYVPPKKSKPRPKLHYATYSYGSHLSALYKPKLSEEELHKVRSEAAKKVAQVRKEREANDPEYAERMRKKRSNAAKKAAETRRRRKQEQPPKTPPEEQSPEEQPPKTPPEEQPPHTPPEEQPPNTPPGHSNKPHQGDSILANVRAELNGAVNEHIAHYLLDLLEDEINTNGEDVVIERLANAPERSIEMANGSSYASDCDDVANCAYSLAYLITGGNVDGPMSEEIEQLAYEDRPYRRKRR